MSSESGANEFFREGYRAYVPHVSVDCVIFGFHGGELKVLLLKWKHVQEWSLPGGYVKRTESLDEAARRVLQERTQLSQIFLRQFHTFGAVDRGEKEVVNELLDAHGVQVEETFWMAERVISVGYYALIDFSKATPVPDLLSEACQWWDLHAIPSLLFDHDHVVEKARQTLRREVKDRPIGYNLLPERFTMPELRQLYETVLDVSLDRRNFQKKMLRLGIVERLDERRRASSAVPVPVR